MSSDASTIAWYLHRSAPRDLRPRVSWPAGAQSEAPPPYIDRVPTRVLAELTESLQSIGGAAVAARAGVQAGARPATALSLLLRVSSSVAAQLEHAVTFWSVLSSSRLERRVLHDSVELAIVQEGHERGAGYDHYAAYLVGMLVGALRGAGIQPVSIGLPGSGSGSLNGGSLDVYGVHAASGVDLPRIRVALDDLQAIPAGADPAVEAFLCEHLGRTLERLRMAISWQVDALIRDRLSQGLGMRDAAKLLGLSERTLRRRLDDEGTSFRERLDSVRRTRALELLAHEDVSPVAHALGFVGARSFQRAFRRWTRMTPLAYKRSLNAAGLHA